MNGDPQVPSQTLGLPDSRERPAGESHRSSSVAQLLLPCFHEQCANQRSWQPEPLRHITQAIHVLRF